MMILSEKRIEVEEEEQVWGEKRKGDKLKVVSVEYEMTVNIQVSK